MAMYSFQLVFEIFSFKLITVGGGALNSLSIMVLIKSIFFGIFFKVYFLV